MTADRLIVQLVTGLEATRSLPPPWLRTARWLALSLLFVVLVVIVASPRGDLMVKLTETRFLIEQAAALLTAVAAAYAAFASTIPGASRKVILVPVVPLAVWLGALGQGCLDRWIGAGLEGLALQPDWMCFPNIALVGSIPAVAMVAMLRRGAPLTPRVTIAVGALAAAGLGNFGLRMFHPQDAGIMVLVWQVGSVLILSALAGLVGRWLFNWNLVARQALRKPRYFSGASGS